MKRKNILHFAFASLLALATHTDAQAKGSVPILFGNPGSSSGTTCDGNGLCKVDQLSAADSAISATVTFVLQKDLTTLNIQVWKNSLSKTVNNPEKQFLTGSYTLDQSAPIPVSEVINAGKSGFITIPAKTTCVVTDDGDHFTVIVTGVSAK